jgi:hypothetical protein
MQPKHPTVDYFKVPPMFPFTLPLGGSLVILLILFFGEGKSQLVDDARQWIGERAGFNTITICTWFAAFMVSRGGLSWRSSAGREEIRADTSTSSPSRRS